MPSNVNSYDSLTPKQMYRNQRVSYIFVGMIYRNDSLKMLISFQFNLEKIVLNSSLFTLVSIGMNYQ